MADIDLLGLLAGGVLSPSDPDSVDDWRYQAACASADPEAFFPEKGGSTREAKRVCAGCDVRAECLAWAIQTGERFGVWGGMSERERRKYAKRHGLPFGSGRLPNAAQLYDLDEFDGEDSVVDDDYDEGEA